jgi:hypothetical protein
VHFGQNQKSSIVGDEPSTATALIGCPTDELVAAFKVAGTRTPTAQGQPLAAKRRDVTELLAYQLMSMEVVMLLHDCLVTFTFFGEDQSHGQVIQNVLLFGFGTAEFRFGHLCILKNLFSIVPNKIATVSYSLLCN